MLLLRAAARCNATPVCAGSVYLLWIYTARLTIANLPDDSQHEAAAEGQAAAAAAAATAAVTGSEEGHPRLSCGTIPPCLLPS
eukprot:COSAG01_NODE_107_length_25964_cov_174.577576_12_plen_83_part_00